VKPIPAPDSPAIKDGFLTIDARGHRCPVPTLKLRRQMEKAADKPGFILWANDPMAQIDIPHFCNQNNCILLSVEAIEETWLFTIERTPR